MKKSQTLAAIVAGIGLSVAAGFAQADKVKFHISYSNSGHGYQSHSYQRHSYSNFYPANHIVQYNYHPYYGIKHHKYPKYQHQQHANCQHIGKAHGGYSPGYKYNKHYSVQQQYGYDKHRRHNRLLDTYYRDSRKHERHGHY